MADFDEYDYLEKQLEQKENGAAANGDVERGREGGRESGRTRDRDRARRSTRDRERDHNNRDRERDRGGSDRARGDRDRKRDRESDRDRERRNRRRSRSASPSRRHRRRRSKSRSRSKGRDRKRASRSPRRERTPAEVRAAREREREMRELERDTRTIFAYNLNLKAEDRDIYEFFSKAGKVIDVKIIMDRNTRKSKGFAYVEFENQEDVLNALALTGQVLMGQAVMVKASEAEKNLAWEAQQQQQQNQAAAAALLGTGLGTSTGPCKLCISSLHVGIQENDLRKIFEPFGELDFIQVVKDSSGASQGYGYVQFKLMSDATKAMQQLNGLEIVGTPLRVQIASVSSADVGMAGLGELDEEDEMGGGMRLSSHARAALMNRLANSAGLQPTSAFGVPNVTSGVAGMSMMPAQVQHPSVPNPMALDQGLLGPASPIPTQCLLIKNMFNPETETEPSWESDIEDEVKEECSKYGEVLHIHVDKGSKGFVYVKFAKTEGSVASQRALHGRWFAGRQIVAEYQFAQVYNSHFDV
ncbi:hypothetical protein BSKO_09423 [Bryopsis sp. KO-2023]|nr:hypothetical protein BSKO_09423 [Bryopsis sp. KO-2023]